VTFWGRDGIASTVRVGDLFPPLDHSAMQPDGDTFYYWGDYSGFNPAGQFEIYVNSAGTLKLDPATGKLVP
jgi:hypothetical protein